MRANEKASARVDTDALVVRSIPYGESDLVITLITEAAGKLGLLVRGGRRSQKRFGGALEPLQTIHVSFDDQGGEHLANLREARIVRVRTRIVSSLDALDAAGMALRWARHLFPSRTREPEGYALIEGLLDALEGGEGEPRAILAVTALRLLGAVGYGLEMDRCVRCARPAPEGRAAFVDGAQGGLVCRACGGASRVLSPTLRALARAAQRGEPSPLDPAQATELLAVIDDAMAAHAGFER